MESSSNGYKIFKCSFQRLMNIILKNIQPRCAVVYIDKITIFSPSLGQHLIGLGKVFKRLSDVNLKINLEKFSL